MAWTNLSFAYGSKLSSSQMTQLFNNFSALANGESGAPQIMNSAIGNFQITLDKMGYDSVDHNVIKDGDVFEINIADSAVITRCIADNTITAVKIIDQNITTAKIADQNITTAKIADNNITEIKMAVASVNKNALKDAAWNSTGTLPSTSSVNIAPGYDFAFFPSVWTPTGGIGNVTMAPYFYGGGSDDPGDAQIRFSLDNYGSSIAYGIHGDYITASDKPFIYAIMDENGIINNICDADDPPVKYWGLDEKPDDFIPPIQIIRKEDKIIKIPHKEIVIFNYDLEEFRGLRERVKKDKKSLCEILNNKFEFDDSKNIFTLKNLSQI